MTVHPVVLNCSGVLHGSDLNHYLGVSNNNGNYPQIIHLFIGFSIIFTIHLGGPLFLVQHPFTSVDC